MGDADRYYAALRPGSLPKALDSKTRLGKLPLRVPRTRDGEFYPQSLEKGLRKAVTFAGIRNDLPQDAPVPAPRRALRRHAPVRPEAADRGGEPGSGVPERSVAVY